MESSSFEEGTGFVQPLEPHEHWHIDISGLIILFVALGTGSEPYSASVSTAIISTGVPISLLLNRDSGVSPDE